MDVVIHYDNGRAFHDPHLWVWYDQVPGTSDDLAPTAHDGFGVVFTLSPRAPGFRFMAKDGAGGGGAGGGGAVWEPDALRRAYDTSTGLWEIWCRADKPFVYQVAPRRPQQQSAAEFLATLTPAAGVHLPDTDGPSGLGATVLAGGGTLFGLYQPNAAQVYVCGTFNDWQQPDHRDPDPARFHPLESYRGYFDLPGLWLGVVPEAAAGAEYKFLVHGGVPRDEHGRFVRWCTDPLARRLGADYRDNNSVVVDPAYAWTDQGFATPDRSAVFLYELSVFGIAEADDERDRSRLASVTRHIRNGYFTDLGVTALSLMPVAEAGSMQGPAALGYDTVLPSALERDYGTPQDLRELVDTAHAGGLAVLLDIVLSHTGNDPNPLWRAILQRPEDEFANGVGGLYFEGTIEEFGNRLATGRRDVANLLIDVCKMWLAEYHVDGFRFDTTNSDLYMDRGFRLRLADELTRFRPRVILVAENLPNQADLDRSGYDGYAQWSDVFHDRMKALLTEQGGVGAAELGDIFYFGRSTFAAHTNNAVNYVESHDESSVARAVGGDAARKDRKGRLGLFAVAVALGVPMIYMGQEFNTDRDRGSVDYHWPPGGPGSIGFYWWASRLIRLRRRYPALRTSGYAPADDGRFTWILGPWMDPDHGGDRRVLGWRLSPGAIATETMVVLLNFEPFAVRVDLELGRPGVWVKLADVDSVNDIAPEGNNSSADPTALSSRDGRFGGFELPGSGAFLYKWESPG